MIMANMQGVRADETHLVWADISYPCPYCPETIRARPISMAAYRTCPHCKMTYYVRVKMHSNTSATIKLWVYPNLFTELSSGGRSGDRKR